jgi:hypothetical protein
MREPPPAWGIDPSQLSLAELIALHEELGRWLEDALSALPEEAPDDELYGQVYAVLTTLSRERVLRQQGELRGRG